MSDSSGEGNDGTLGLSSSIETLDPTWVDGKYGKALSFDGSNDVVQVPHSSSLDHGSEEFTWSAWIKLDTLGRTHTIGSTYNINNAFTVLQISSANRIVVSIRDAGGGTGSVTGNTVLSLDTWYHVAVTRSGTTIKVFLNETEDNSGGGPSGDTYHGTAKFNVGAHATNGPQTTFTDFLDGTIDDISIYNKALTTNEIKALYTASGERILEPGQIVTIIP